MVNSLGTGCVLPVVVRSSHGAAFQLYHIVSMTCTNITMKCIQSRQLLLPTHAIGMRSWKCSNHVIGFKLFYSHQDGNHWSSVCLHIHRERRTFFHFSLLSAQKHGRNDLPIHAAAHRYVANTLRMPLTCLRGRNSSVLLLKIVPYPHPTPPPNTHTCARVRRSAPPTQRYSEGNAFVLVLQSKTELR